MLSNLDPQKAYSAAQASLSGARKQMHSLNDLVQTAHYDPNMEEMCEQEENYLKWKLKHAYRSFCILLQVLELNESLTEFKNGFLEFSDDLSKLMHYENEPDFVYSLPIDFISDFLSSVTPLLEETTFIDGKRDVLVSILRQTSALIQEQNASTTKEKDVQDILESFLKAAFPNVIRHPTIQQQLKAYKPDFGIESIGAAIEIKYAKKKNEVGTLFGGLYEDMKGYSGAPEYSAFYGLFYMTGAYTTQERADAEARKVGVSKDWEIIVLVGR